ncbi:plasmid stabilization protein [Halogeometricum borinquense]|uniref:Plasmid stabilization protein n=1 Tax=Halogeometricum borinquense TaxID=60847 RepID=A0A6C0UDL6_9EURY|nr:plastocyanin/azurin family copper-binding protein [Halogeometricum borinquense]QIB73237.1 plasmid stabilization protein [Halogeometricum borinquense]QIQ77366.1 plasmid stabilization protein [Halogeometricum borinquense]
MQQRRRQFLKLTGVGLTASFAGCAANEDEGTETEPATQTPTGTPTPTATGGSQPPGADVLGGPNDLQSEASVRAAVLDGDQGAGKFVFTPAVVWVESGTTVSWTIEGMAHSVTAYHEDNDKPHRVPEGASAFDSGTLEAGTTFEQTFETPGVYNYYCTPHEGLGMVGLVVVDAPQSGPGTTDPAEDLSGAAAEHLSMQLDAAGIGEGDSEATAGYAWSDATWDSYWYSLYNMSTNIAMSGNGVLFPHNEEQQQAFDKRVPAMLKHADADKPPVKKPNLNMAPFTTGDPNFTQHPVLQGEDGRPDASTLKWDLSKSSKVVSPASVAWTHLKGVTWAKNFQTHFDTLPPGLAAKFRAQMLTTLAQIGVNATLIAGGPNENGALTQADGSFPLVSGFKPGTGEVVDGESRPNQHAAMLWYLSNLNSLAQNGWFGYVNPEPLIPAKKIQALTDGMAKATMQAFDPETILSTGTTRDLGVMLGGVGWYGTQAGSAEMRQSAVEYANALASAIESNHAGNGRIENGAENDAATQGVVAQGLLWADQLSGVDTQELATPVVGFLLDELWDADAGTFASSPDATTYHITSRDAGDTTGGLNAADVLLDVDVQETYARYFNQTFNRGRLQRAERPQSRDTNAEHTLPLPPAAGGEFGQAAVYNDAVEYDTESDAWIVVDDGFTTANALYLANQDIWISQWGGDFYRGRGVPGQAETPP